MQLKPTSQGKSWLDRIADRISPQPAEPGSPEPPRVDQTQWEKAVDSHKLNTLTVHDVGLIVFGETQSVMNSDHANDTLDGTRQKVAHAIINGDLGHGLARPRTARPIEPSAKELKDSNIRKAYDTSLAAAREAYLSPTDPTQGATHFNLRPNANRSNFKPGDSRGPGFIIRTQSGPFNNSFPTSGKNGLPSRGIYVNTYGPD
jgi:hypothetical protein